jgi:hypothetical protein
MSRANLNDFELGPLDSISQHDVEERQQLPHGRDAIGLPVAFSRSAKHLMIGLHRIAVIAAMYKAVYFGGFTKASFDVKHEKCNAKKTAANFGRWIGARQDVGPWSLPLTADIMFGGVSSSIATFRFSSSCRRR